MCDGGAEAIVGDYVAGINATNTSEVPQELRAAARSETPSSSGTTGPRRKLCSDMPKLTNSFSAGQFHVSRLSNSWVMALVNKLLSPAYQFQDQDEPCHFPRVYFAVDIRRGQIPGRLQI